MAKATIEVFTCDGTIRGGKSNCGKPVRTQADGLVFRGNVFAPEATTAPLIGPQPGVRSPDHNAETALCWDCFHSLVIDPVLARARADAEQAQRARAAYRSDYSSSSDSSLYREPGGGPTGPCDPPDMPHYVAVTQALTGVR